jgi:hypothetical protein
MPNYINEGGVTKDITESQGGAFAQRSRSVSERQREQRTLMP